MTEDSLTPEERTAMSALPRETPLPVGLEDRVVDGLRRADLIRRRPGSRWIGYVAAAVLLVCLGISIGVFATRAVPPQGPRYLLLLYGAPDRSDTDAHARIAEYSAWARDERAAGRLLNAEKLAEGRAVLGPSAAAPRDEDPAGFFVIAARSMSDAQAIAASCPHLRHGGTVVVRTIEDTR